MIKSKKMRIILTSAVVVLALSATVFAKVGSQLIEVYYSDIKLDVNGIRVDTSNNEPFIYNGTTYLPVRAVAEALGQNVDWDGNTKTVYIGDKPIGVAYLMEVCPPYQTKSYNSYHSCRTYYQSETQSFVMGGEKYTNGLTMAGCNSSSTYALFNLNGKYKTAHLKIGHLDNGTKGTVGIAFIVDGKTVKECNIAEDEYPKEISIPLNYGLQLKIVTIEGEGWGEAGLGNITVE